MLDKIDIPKDITRGLIYINVIILIIILAHALVAPSNNIIPDPRLFVFSSLVSIALCFCVQGYKESIYNSYMAKRRRSGDLYTNGYAERINISNALSIISFFILHMFAFVMQYR